MFKRIIFIGILFGLIVSTSACMELEMDFSTSELSEESDALIQDLTDYFGDLLAGDIESPENAKTIDEATLVQYTVEDYQLTDRIIENDISKLKKIIHDYDLHQETWDLYAHMMPEEYLEYISQFYIFSDGPDELLAYVQHNEDDPSRWILGVDLQDSEEITYLVSTLIHEFAHILTLNDTQAEVDMDLFYDDENDELYDLAVENCDYFFNGDSCLYEDSYLYEFFTAFWGDIFEEWLEVSEYEEEEYEDALYDFWETYEDEFVTEYAATSPDEDIAESFTHFVLTPKPEGTSIAEEKVLFFYQYPELVKMRRDILKRYEELAS
jgi:hypothetical protein